MQVLFSAFVIAGVRFNMSLLSCTAPLQRFFVTESLVIAFIITVVVNNSSVL